MSTTEEMPDPLAVWTLINSHVVARCIHMVADFGVPDAIDGEPVSADELCGPNGHGRRRVGAEAAALVGAWSLCCRSGWMGSHAALRAAAE